MIKRAIIDSGIWIGLRYQKDQYNNQAEEIITHFRNGLIREVYVTDYIIIETINFLIRNVHFEVALKTLKAFDSQRIKIIFFQETNFKHITSLFTKFQTFSLTDCSIIALTEMYDVHYIFSFDTNFDKIKTIKRIEKL